MKTILLTFSTILCIPYTKATEVRSKRGHAAAYAFTGHLPYLDLYEPLHIPLHETQLYSLGIDSFLPIPKGSVEGGSISLAHSLAASKANIYPVAFSNSIEKPVQEASDSIPQPSTGTAVIPLQPPPAVPVNAAAANVPSNNGAVFLGSGGLGVINLGNGAFALGSGGIGYSNQRQQPRPNGRSPLYPPLAASPNLVPAATPSQQPASIPQTHADSQPTVNGFQFSQPLFMPNVNQPQIDQNGYERLNPNSAGFGMPSPRIRPLKTRNSYATPTIPQIQVEAIDSSQLPMAGFGDPIPRLPAQAVKYV